MSLDYRIEHGHCVVFRPHVMGNICSMCSYSSRPCVTLGVPQHRCPSLVPWNHARLGLGLLHGRLRRTPGASSSLRARAPRRGVGRCSAHDPRAQPRPRAHRPAARRATRAFGPRRGPRMCDARVQPRRLRGGLQSARRSFARPGARGTWLSTAALVVEIVSPGDETWEKLPFYASHNVDEVLIIDPLKRSVTWLELAEVLQRAVL